MNNRKWIGIDQSEHAIKATKEKLETVEGDLFIVKPDYEFIELTDTMPSCQQKLNDFFILNKKRICRKILL